MNGKTYRGNAGNRMIWFRERIIPKFFSSVGFRWRQNFNMPPLPYLEYEPTLGGDFITYLVLCMNRIFGLNNSIKPVGLAKSVAISADSDESSDVWCSLTKRNTKHLG